MKKATTTVPSQKLALYEELVATSANVELKGKTMPYTSAGGHMFSFLTPTGTLALRLPADERAAFIKKYKTRLCEQHGRVLQEYVEVPDALLKKTQELRRYFTHSCDYVSSLPPKATKKTATKRRA